MVSVQFDTLTLVVRKMQMKQFGSIDSYIQNYPAEVQPILEKLRQVIKKVAPEAQEAMSYGIPTFKLNGNLVHFGAYKNHIGFYPGSEAIQVFAKDLEEYTLSKGTVQFPLNEPLPFSVIEKMVSFRVAANLAKKKK